MLFVIISSVRGGWDGFYPLRARFCYRVRSRMSAASTATIIATIIIATIAAIVIASSTITTTTTNIIIIIISSRCVIITTTMIIVIIIYKFILWNLSENNKSQLSHPYIIMTSA